MKRHCDICGKEANEHWMHSFNTGTKLMWLCWDCYINSQREAAMSDMYRQKKLHKLLVSKKRNR